MFFARAAGVWMMVLASGAAWGQAPAPAPATAFGQKSEWRRGQLAEWRKWADTEGNGPFKATYAMGAEGREEVVYQPRDLAGAARARKLGIYIWGNGGCQGDGAAARFHLTEVASRGFVAIAPGRIGSGPRGEKAGEGVTAEKMVAALDWILAENGRAGSAYFGLLDARRVAVGGNSCGGLIALKAGMDKRVRALAVQNSGVLPDGTEPGTRSVAGMRAVKKADLAKLHTPVLYINGGPEDIAQPNALDDFKRIEHVPVFVADQPGTGHTGTFHEPNGEATRVELDWIAWQLDGDAAAGRTFAGADCGLCRDYRWVVHKKRIR